MNNSHTKRHKKPTMVMATKRLLDCPSKSNLLLSRAVISIPHPVLSHSNSMIPVPGWWHIPDIVHALLVISSPIQIRQL
jgi:hypothetical protein